MSGPDRHIHFGDGTDWAPHEASRGVSGSAAGHLRLAPAPDGPLSAASADGSLGGLLLPRGLALDEQRRLYLVDPEGRLSAFDGSADEGRGAFRRLASLPAATGEPPAATLMVRAGRAFVWSAERRTLLALDLRARRGDSSARLRQVDLPFVKALSSHLVLVRGVDTVDLCARGRELVVLLVGLGIVLRLDPRTLAAEPLWLDAARAPLVVRGHAWQRVLADRRGGLVLMAPASASPTGRTLFRRFTPDGRWDQDLSDPNALRGRLEPVWIRADERGRFRVPDFLREPVRRIPPPGLQPLYPDDPHGKDPDRAVPFDRGPRQQFDGAAQVHELRPDEPRRQLLYARRGAWISPRLDGRSFRCEWGRVVLVMDAMPSGTTLRISTYTTDVDEPEGPDGDGPDLLDRPWQPCLVVTRATLEALHEGDDWAREVDALAGGRRRLAGRYLWVRLDLEGDGFRSPVVRCLSVEPDYASLSRHLPSVYRSDRESQVLLERFLAIAQTEWDDLERRLDQLPRLFDPQRVPDGPALDYLAGWIDAPVDLGRTPRQRRRLLLASSRHLGSRGTPAALRDLVDALLRPDDDPAPDPDRAPGLPAIVEGFRLRDQVVLGAPGSHALGGFARLDELTPEDGLKLGVTSWLDRARMVRDPIPEERLPRAFAHRFEVVVPAAWLAPVEARERLDALLERERPAHTEALVRAVEPGVRVGMKCRVGLDTLIGPPPRMRLGFAPGAPDDPGPRLGWDTILGDDQDGPESFPDPWTPEPSP